MVVEEKFSKQPELEVGSADVNIGSDPQRGGNLDQPWFRTGHMILGKSWITFCLSVKRE